jgi:hypothetical protein
MTTIGKDFPLSRELRKEKLKRILTNKHVGSIKVPGKGRKSVYQIPLECLSYNPHNTRFIAQSKTLETKNGRPLDDSEPEDIKAIEEIIWNLSPETNESTINSLIKDGQLQPGIVTSDGVILSGNRRFRLLNEISRNHDKYSNPTNSLEGLQYFEAAILDQELSEKDIVRFESFYQYGTDEKQNYDPIQKYLAAHDRKERLGLSLQDIAEDFQSLTQGKTAQVTVWLETYDLMDQYLTYIDEVGIYTALETKEEAFLNLRRTLRSYRDGKKRSNDTDWAFDEFDLDALKLRYFDYIHLGSENRTFDFRLFPSIFKNGRAWKAFNTRVEAIQDKHPLDSFQDYRVSYPEETESQISDRRGIDYRAAVSDQLARLLDNERARLDVEGSENAPLKILVQIKQQLNDLLDLWERDKGRDVFALDDFSEGLDEIKKQVGTLKFKVSKG